MSGQPWSFLVSVNGVGGQVFGRNNVLIADDTGLTGTVNGTVGGENLYLVAVPRTGYVFNHWTTEGGDFTYNPMDQPMPYTGNYHIAAYFVPVAATATTLSLSCSPAHGVLPWTATMTATLFTSNGPVPNASVFFQYLGADGVSWYNMFDAPSITDISGIASRTVTFDASGGWVTGTTSALRAHFAGDAAFVGSDSSSITVTMDAAGETFTLTISVSGIGGTTDPSGTITGNVGDIVTATAHPDLGYQFDHWLADGTEIYTDNPISGPMAYAGAHTFEAFFTPISSTTKTLTISATTGGTTNPAAGGTYPNGTVVSVQAIPALGYVFSNWILDGSNGGATNPYPVTMNADHDLLAVFVPASTETWNWKDDFTSQNSRWNWSYKAGTGFKRITTKDGLSVAEIGITAASVSTQYSDDDLQGFVISVASNKTIILEGNLKFSFSPQSPTVGTWGFGFWDSGIGQTVWFLGCSPESDADMRGFRAIMTGAGGVFLVNQLIDVDQTQWHVYRLEISGTGVIWKVDGVVVAQTSNVPTGSMGSALWNDNGVVINHQETGNLNASIDEIIWIDYVAYKETTVVQDSWHLAVSAGAGGTVSPTSASGLAGDSTPPITATPDATHIFSHWILDGSQLAEVYNPITIQINDVADNHTLQAVFTAIPQGWLGVDANIPNVGITVVKVS